MLLRLFVRIAFRSVIELEVSTPSSSDRVLCLQSLFQGVVPHLSDSKHLPSVLAKLLIQLNAETLGWGPS